MLARVIVKAVVHDDRRIPIEIVASVGYGRATRSFTVPVYVLARSDMIVMPDEQPVPHHGLTHPIPPPVPRWLGPIGNVPNAAESEVGEAPMGVVNDGPAPMAADVEILHEGHAQVEDGDQRIPAVLDQDVTVTNAVATVLEKNTLVAAHVAQNAATAGKAIGDFALSPAAADFQASGGLEAGFPEPIEDTVMEEHEEEGHQITPVQPVSRILFLGSAISEVIPLPLSFNHVAISTPMILDLLSQ